MVGDRCCNSGSSHVVDFDLLDSESGVVRISGFLTLGFSLADAPMVYRDAETHAAWLQPSGFGQSHGGGAPHSDEALKN